MLKNYKLFYLIFMISISQFYSACSNNNNESSIKTLSILEDSVDSTSYAIGANAGDAFISQGIDLDYDAFITGVMNGYEKKQHILTMQERQLVSKNLQLKIRSKRRQLAKVNLKKAEKFLNSNKEENADIIETNSGLQYRVIKKGKGKSPDTASDQVRVHYEGKLVDGTIFDSSYERGEPFVTRLNAVIRGWTEGVQLMSEGSEFEFFIHPRLAYGDSGSGKIPPNSALIFKIELQKVFEKNMK